MAHKMQSNNDSITNTCGTHPIKEAEVLASFLKIVNEVIRGNDSVNPMSERTAMKFLVARKFDSQRALQLYQMHEVTRLREGLINLDPEEEALKAELDSGKFTILKHRDDNDSAIAVFTARLHLPNKSKNNSFRKGIHRNTLQGIVYQLDAALEDIITQRNGIVFIYNMSDSEYSNFDYELCQKILNLLKGAYPAKLKKVLIVSPPFWFRAPFHLLRLIVREKLRDRVWLLSSDQLKDHIPQSTIPKELGGAYDHNHQVWLEECALLHKARLHDLCDTTSAQNLTKSIGYKSTNSLKRPYPDGSLNLISHNDLEANALVNPTATSNKVKNTSRPSKNPVFDYDDSGFPINQYIQLVRTLGKEGLGEEYDAFEKKEKTGTFLVSTSPMNLTKNRWINIVCYDNTRVVLEPYDLPEGINLNDPMDYINASFVDGYRQPRAYISTQGPIQHTFMDFWRMMWQTGSRVIVMVTLNIESGILKCDKYWPTADKPNMEVGVYKIDYITSEIFEDFVLTHLKLTNTRSEVSRDIKHLQFISWPDFGTPQTASALLKFRDCVLKKQLDAIELAGSNYPPIVVHCSAGVGRSGTFITVDICIQKLETTGLIDVRNVVEKLRQQRYLSVQTKDQYIFCHKSVLEYAASCKLIDIDDIDDLF